MTIKKILVPTDGSEPANRAIDYAATLAKATGAKLDILTVVDLRQVTVRGCARIGFGVCWRVWCMTAAPAMAATV